MEILGRRLRGIWIGGSLLCGGLSMTDCSSSPRRFGDGDSGAAGQKASSGGNGGTLATAGNAGQSDSSRAGSAAEAGTSGKGANGTSGAAGDGTSGAAGDGGMASVGGSGAGGAHSNGGAAGSGNGGSAGTSAVCGDKTVQAPTEQCDDGNTSTEACSYGLKSCTVCNATCKSVAGAVAYCGDSTTQSGYETCDDGNATTESCTYGQSSCSVCDATCHTVAGAISYCGDSVRQTAHEACDNGTANSTNGNCSPTCTTCDKVPGTEPVTYDDTSWTGGLSFTVTKATTLYQFKVYHNDSSYQLNLYQLSAADTAPAADATPIWKMPVASPKASTFDTIDVTVALSAGKSYLLTTVGQVMSVSVPNPAAAYPAQSLSGITVTKYFSVQDTLDLDQGSFRTTAWGPFTDLRACLQSPN